MHSNIGIRSNIGLAISGNHTELAKGIWIGFYNSAESKLLVEFGAILDALKQCKFDCVRWENVKQFNYCESDYCLEISKRKNDEAALLGYLSRRLPDLDSVVCHNLTSTTGNVVNYDELFYMPSKYIRKIGIRAGRRRVSMRSHFYCLLRGLSYLRISGGIVDPGTGSMLPAKVYAPSLQYLRFSLNPQEFDWGVFHDDRNDNECVEFSSLKELDLSFRSDDRTTNIQNTTFGKTIGRCKFPALTDLTLRWYYRKTLELIPLILPNCPSLKSLCVGYINTNEFDICETDTGFLSSLESLTLMNVNNMNTEYSDLILHKLQSNMPLARSININLSIYPINANSPVITFPSNTGCWQNLQRFAIHSHVNISTIPALLELYRADLIMDNAEQHLIMNLMTLGSQKPISTSLQEIVLLICKNGNTSMGLFIVAYFGMIALAIPSLKRLKVPETNCDTVVKYIKVASPHRKFATSLYDLALNSTLLDFIKPSDLTQ